MLNEYVVDSWDDDNNETYSGKVVNNYIFYHSTCIKIIKITFLQEIGYANTNDQ